MDFNKFIYRYITFGLWKDFDEIKDGIPRVLVWTVVVIPTVAFAFFNISPENTPLSPLIYMIGTPLQRVGNAGLDSLKMQAEINNNAISGNGFKPGSVEGLENTLVEENQN